MIKTGYISFITESGGGYDADGNPIASTKVNSAYIECNLKTITRKYEFVVDGQYVQAKYSMYFDQDKINSLNPAITLSTINNVQIKDNNLNDLGVHQVHNLEYLNLTKRIKVEV